jgi:hypothetical protein
MPKDSLRNIRKHSEREYLDMVERIAARVWAILKENARHEKERRGTNRSTKS